MRDGRTEQASLRAFRVHPSPAPTLKVAAIAAFDGAVFFDSAAVTAHIS
jgi:hypothetical protein